MSNIDKAPQARRRRRWFQFGLSALLLATALIAIVVAWQRPRIELWLEALRGRPTSSGPMVIIKIDPNGGVLLGSRHVEMDELQLFLAKEITFLKLTARLAEGEEFRPVICVCVEGATPMANVRDVIEVARDAGFSEIELRQDK